MPLSQLTYCSRVQNLGPEDVQAILDVSRKGNQAADVTGMLLYDRRGFLQCLEGEREQVTATFARIVADPRHDQVALIAVHDIENRDFPDWTMGYVVTKLPQVAAVLADFGLGETFQPQQMSANAAVSLMKRMRDLNRTV